ncbi:MAG: radical SAM protein, partial [Oscillospiraceae bacterium]
AGNVSVKRFRLTPEEVLASARAASELGFRRIFLISGEDPKYGFDRLLSIVSGAHALGLWVSLACGEFSPEQYQELHAAGANEYVLKFEMSDREVFNRLNPSTDFDRRMKSIEEVLKSGMRLASGNIVDYPGQTLSQLADDLLLMQRLGISWAPVIPFLPAQHTPLGTGARGNLLVNITAQQPGEDLSQGLAGAQGNLAALAAGANMLFADLLPDALTKNFSVVDNRVTLGLDHIREMARRSGMSLSF